MLVERPLGLIEQVPPAWLAGTNLPDDGSDLEFAWCRHCARYLWRELGSPYGIALTPRLSWLTRRAGEA